MTGTDTRTPRPRLRRHLGIEAAPAATFVFTEHDVTTLRGVARSVVDRLDGTRDAADIARTAGLDDDVVDAVLAGLARAGLVTQATEDGATQVAPAEAAWWDACGTQGRHPGGRVSLEVLDGDLDGAAVADALCRAGLAVADGSPSAPVDLHVVICADYLDPALDAVDRRQAERGEPWLLAKPDGTTVWVGPVFRPGTTGCWHCLALPLSAHRRPEAMARAALGGAEPARRPRVGLPSGTALATDLVALESVKFVSGMRHDNQSGVLTFDTRDATSRHHVLRRRPQCPACGDPRLVAAAAERPVRLGDGGAAEPGAERAQDLVSPVTGLVKALVRDDRTPPFAHAYRSGPTLAHRGTARGVAGLRRERRFHNAGKGLRADDARTGALFEAVERYCGSWQGDERAVRGSLRSLGPDAIDPREVLLVDERQRRPGAPGEVPAAFDPDALLDWTPVWSLTGTRRRLLPSAMLYFDAPASPMLEVDSNGCAAGARLEDAVLGGLLELVERDAVALWWYSGSVLPGIDLASFADPEVTAQLAHHAGLGRELWALDLSADLGVPVVAAVSRRADSRADSRAVLGFGAHPDPHRAVRGALAEVNQMLATDDEPAGADVAHLPHLAPDPRTAPRRAAAWPATPERTAGDEVRALVARLRRHGLEPVALDQTRPDVGVPVARVVVPGLRPWHARFAPGRLFDVPVRLGRRDRPVPYGDLPSLPLPV